MLFITTAIGEKVNNLYKAGEENIENGKEVKGYTQCFGAGFVDGAVTGAAAVGAVHAITHYVKSIRKAYRFLKK